MTEAEWLACDDPMGMYPVVKRPLSRRVAVLFGAACARATPEAERQSLLQRAVEAVERSANGSEGWDGVDLLQREAESACHRVELESAAHFWALAVLRLTESEVSDYWMHVPLFLSKAVAKGGEAAAGELRRLCADFLRDVVGNPFQGGRGRRFSKRARKPQPEPLFRSEWGTPAVLALAGEAHESRDFSAMPILADALEDIGCSDSLVLAHLRGPGPHIPGCWVVDALLGKEWAR
jgi:hypothetical protein